MTLVLRRRGFLGGLMAAAGLVVAAPAIIRTPGLLMPVKPPLREVPTWKLSKIYLTELGVGLDLPEYVEEISTVWQDVDRDSARVYTGAPYYMSNAVNAPVDRHHILAKTYIEVPAGIDLSDLGPDWNVEGSRGSRLSRL